MPTERWQPAPTKETQAWPMPARGIAIARGLRGVCPACGKGRIFAGFLKVNGTCRDCAAPLGLARADDAPPYFTILLVGHIIVPLLFLVERSWQLPLWLMAAIFLPLTLLLTLGLIQPIKGGTVGLMLSLDMLKPDPSAA